jgi:hypothetical protein
MISLVDYFNSKLGHPECTELMKMHAMELLGRVGTLLDEARLAGVYKDWIDPDTGTCISGSKGGSGDGGFRLSTSTTGSPYSQHKKARAIDIFDPDNALDNWLSDTILSRHGLYREAPQKTLSWTHLQSVPPLSGRRTFMP